jgi:hypothetical protein
MTGLHRTFWPGRSLDGAFLDHYAICTLKPS